MAEHEHDAYDQRLGRLEDWRKLIVDPKLEEHETKISSFERMEMQITGVVKFVKATAVGVGLLVGICEILRAVEPLLKK